MLCKLLEDPCQRDCGGIVYRKRKGSGRRLRRWNGSYGVKTHPITISEFGVVIFPSSAQKNTHDIAAVPLEDDTRLAEDRQEDRR
jgi:hypothetical protein